MMKRPLFLRLAMVGALLLALGLAPSSSANPLAAEAGGCTALQRQEALAEDQRLVLQQVGDLSTLRNPADVVALAQCGWNFLPHQWVSFKGIGWVIGRTDGVAGLLVPGLPAHHGIAAPQVGLPALLAYRPGPTAVDVTDSYGPDFPYELVGWAYGAPYDYDNYPPTAGRCYVRSDWAVHERGIHDLGTWGFVPVPPPEQFHGQA